MKEINMTDQVGDWRGEGGGVEEQQQSKNRWSKKYNLNPKKLNTIHMNEKQKQKSWRKEAT